MIYRVLFILKFNKVRERHKRSLINLSIWGQGGRNDIRPPTLNLCAKESREIDLFSTGLTIQPAVHVSIQITLSRFPLVSRWSHLNSLYSGFRTFSTLIFSYLPTTQTKGRSSSPYSNTVILPPPPLPDLTNYPIFF